MKDRGLAWRPADDSPLVRFFSSLSAVLRPPDRFFWVSAHALAEFIRLVSSGIISHSGAGVNAGSLFAGCELVTSVSTERSIAVGERFFCVYDSVGGAYNGVVDGGGEL